MELGGSQMKKYLIPIFLIFGIIIVYLLYNYFKIRQKERIKYLAAWTILENSEPYRCNIPLHGYIAKAQINLLEQYQISTEDDWVIAKGILSSFQTHMSEKLLTDRLVLPKTKHAISGQDFFMFNLQTYLEKHQFDYSFIGYNMHEKTISRTDYEPWGTSRYEATYSLTHFAVIFFKLYYISLCYCKNSKELNAKGIEYESESVIEDVIDSRRLSILRL
jgi:hypothetical protein